MSLFSFNIKKSILFIGFFIINAATHAQTLTILNGGNTGTSDTNWSITGTTLTVTGAASIDASVIANALTNGNLSVVGNSTNFVVTVSKVIIQLLSVVA